MPIPPRAGFSLVELLVVMSVIAILATTASMSYTEAARETRDTKRIADMEAIGHALELFYQDNGRYPGACDGVSTDGEIIGEGETIDGLLAPYLGQVPSDPLQGENPAEGLLYFYAYDPNHTVDECSSITPYQGVVYGFNHSETGISDEHTCTDDDMNLNNADFNRSLTPVPPTSGC